MRSMTFEELYDVLPQGWLTINEARLLYREAAKTEGPILEVGCLYGRSTVLLASFNRKVHAVDPFAGFDSDDVSGEVTYKKFVENLRSREITNVTRHKCKVEEWRPRKVGFAYLDGDHTYDGTRRQINAALRCKAQVVAIHDVNDMGEGAEIKRAALEMLGPWKERVERLAVWTS